METAEKTGSSVRDAARKTITNQTSADLVKKLENARLIGASKEVAVEVLKDRIAKGKFEYDEKKLDAFLKGSSAKVSTEKAKTEKKEKPAKEKKEKKEKPVKEKKERKSSYEGKFKKGDKVKFSPFRSEEILKGEVQRCYIYKDKKLGEEFEGVVINVEDDKGKVVTYRKNVENVTKA